MTNQDIATLLPIRGSSYTQAGWRQVLFGRDSRLRIAGTVAELGRQRAFILTSPSVKRLTPLVDEARESLGEAFVGTYASCRPHSPVDTVFEAADLVRSAGADVLICIGGSSIVDTSKAVALAVANSIRNEADLLTYVIEPGASGGIPQSRLSGKPIPQISLPTTLAGSEFSGVAGITHASEDAKLLYADPAFYFDTIILDPTATLETPSEIWLSSGMKLLDNTIESICSRGSQPIVSTLALEAMRLLPLSLRETFQDTKALDPRSYGQYAVWMAVFAVHNGWGNIGAALRHQLGATYGIVHGYSSSILVPHILRFMAPHIGNAMGVISRALGADAEKGGPDAYHRLALELGLPTRLRDIGVPKEDIPRIAKGALRQFVARQTVVPMDQASVEGILQSAW